jgi:cytoskeleton protein RodZ
MTELTTGPAGATAGAILRAARERQGLHIAALAAAIKVTPRKLDALEHDRYDELPDATFTRALAQTVCRSLKVDPAPVLALLPSAQTAALDHVTGSLNTPFRERPGREDPGHLAVAAVRPLAWAGVALLLAAVFIYVVPSDWWTQRTSPAPAGAAGPVAPLPTMPASMSDTGRVAQIPADQAPEAMPAASMAMAASSAPAILAPTAQQSPASAVLVAATAERTDTSAPSAGAASAAVAQALVQLRSDKDSWCDVRDARGTVLLSRVVLAGETVGLDGALPIRLTIGNASSTRLSVRGKPVELAASTRDNVARLEVQ